MMIANYPQIMCHLDVSSWEKNYKCYFGPSVLQMLNPKYIVLGSQTANFKTSSLFFNNVCEHVHLVLLSCSALLY